MRVIRHVGQCVRTGATVVEDVVLDPCSLEIVGCRDPQVAAVHGAIGRLIESVVVNENVGAGGSRVVRVAHDVVLEVLSVAAGVTRIGEHVAMDLDVVQNLMQGKIRMRAVVDVVVPDGDVVEGIDEIGWVVVDLNPVRVVAAATWIVDDVVLDDTPR